MDTPNIHDDDNMPATLPGAGSIARAASATAADLATPKSAGAVVESLDFLDRPEIREKVQKRETVPIEGVGDFLIQGMPAEARDEVESRFAREDASGGDATIERRRFRATVVAICWVRADGTRPAVGDDAIARLQKWPAWLIQTLYEPAARLSGISSNAKEKTKGNSASADGATSSARSQSTSFESSQTI